MTIQDLKDQRLIIFEGIVGSQAYGIATPTSDVDIKGVFMMPLEGLLNFDYVEQVSDEKNDTTYYELRRFLQLLQTNNPNILELLNLPEDCILHKDPIFDMILSKRDLFITRACKLSFGGYAVEQIKKARGLNKKIVKPFDEKRKGVLDFCYVPFEQGSILVKEYLEIHGMKQEYCGLVALPHMRFTYGVHYDRISELIDKGISVPRSYTKFKGIVQDEEKSNEVSLSDVPRESMPAFVMQFNSDGYSVYCREYREYWDWVSKRNQSRFSDNMLHGKGYDGKNLAHCHRLLDMAIEIGEGKGINVRRNNREQLLSIRKGEYDYDKLVEEAEEKIRRMDEVFSSSSLPEKIEHDFVNNLLLTMRRQRNLEPLLKAVDT
jgi:predicted nucleotidyltransferase